MSITFKLDRRFTSQAKGVLEKYQFEVGILQDKIHKAARDSSAGLSSYAGGPTRKTSGQSGGKTISEVSQDIRARTGINIFTDPFSSKKNSEILNFVHAYFELCAGKTQKKRVENLLQAIVRNPILRGDYGRNTRMTAKIKGFNRLFIDTSQLFRAIMGKVKVTSVSK